MTPKTIKRTVDAYGCICYNTKEYFVSHELVGETITVTEAKGRLTATFKDGTKKRLSKTKGKQKFIIKNSTVSRVLNYDTEPMSEETAKLVIDEALGELKSVRHRKELETNGRLSFAAIHGATEGFTSTTLRGLKALREKIAETTCREDALALVDDLITGYTKSQNSFLGRAFPKRKDSSLDKGDKP